MRGEYDLFEKFPDGAAQWRMSVVGRFEALRKVQELRERSENEFFIFRSSAVRRRHSGSEVLESELSEA